MRRVQIADLEVVLGGGSDREGGGDGPMLVLLHGYGAPGEDLVPLARQIVVDRSVRFAFPAAPLALDRGGSSRAWWPIDMMALQRAVMMRDYAALTETEPEGLTEARERMDALLDTLEREHGMARSRLILGGFSQGAMLATDVTLRAERPPAALIVFSGTLITKASWLPLMKARAGMEVLQSHGRADPVLSFHLAEQLRDEMLAAGLKVEFHASSGGHSIPNGVVTAAGQLVSRVTT